MSDVVCIIVVHHTRVHTEQVFLKLSRPIQKIGDYKATSLLNEVKVEHVCLDEVGPVTSGNKRVIL